MRVNDPATTPKRLEEGDWAFKNIQPFHNARVASVVWDPSLHGFQGGWRYQVPGLSDPDLMPARDDLPFMQYRKIRKDTWELVGPCDRDTQNIGLEGVL